MTDARTADNEGFIKSTETVTGIRPSPLATAPSGLQVTGNTPTYAPPPLGVTPPPPAGRVGSIPPQAPAGLAASRVPPLASASVSARPPVRVSTTPVGLSSPRSAPPPVPADALTRSVARASVAPVPPSRPSLPPQQLVTPSSVPPASAALRSSVPPPPPRRDDSREQLLKVQAELRELRTELAQQREQVKGRDTHIAELRATLSERDTALAELRATLAALQEKLAVAAPVGDDLKRIRGIGPGFERTLKQAGVERFSQIAEWTSEDVARFAELLHTQPARIERGNWVAQARTLTDGSGQVT